MRPLLSRTARLLAAGLLLALDGCSSKGLVIDPPPIAPNAVGEPVRIGTVRDARAFTNQSFAAPVPSTRGDVDDPEWTRRVVGRRRATARTLGGDRFTHDPAGVPELVRAALAAGLSRAGHPVLEPQPPDDSGTPQLDAVIEVFWIREAMRSTSARLIYHAEVTVSGDLPGLDPPARLRAHGSMSSGAADDVLWRRATGRALEELAQGMADAILAGQASEARSSDTAMRRAKP